MQVIYILHYLLAIQILPIQEEMKTLQKSKKKPTPKRRRTIALSIFFNVIIISFFKMSSYQKPVEKP